MKTDLFDYPLPPERIAQRPAERRDESRLMVVHRAARRVEHRRFRDIGEYLQTGDRLFRNTAAVLPARLHGRRPTGGAVECLLLRALGDESVWECLLRPGKKLPPGATFAAPDGAYAATVLEKHPDGTARVSFALAGGKSLAEVAEAQGEMPLPPYLLRDGTGEERALDRARYQTVYAERGRAVAAAAPTAGLHFTEELLTTLAGRGVRFGDLTLHVGLGTFRPIQTEEIEAHRIHRETYEIPPATRALWAERSGARRLAVGTTSLRTLEDYARRPESTERPEQRFFAESELYVYPPYEFRAVDALLTNFHQPRSTLLCLVAAFLEPNGTGGIAWLKELYAEALAREYRFLSYGDALLLL